MGPSDLNVRLGLIYKDFDKSLKNVETSLNRTADRMSSIGNGLSVGLTLPLLAFGKSAVTASAEMENMRLAMESTMKAGGRSIGEAHKELEALRVAALAPGLDLQQAVQGSIRLQNVGFSAEKARATLVQLANAVAMTGGTAQNLDSVTVQFGQMIAKGRILQQDLGIIQENMPAISQAMEKAFGTKSSEKLRDMGVSAEQFIQGVTEQLALLPRVSGGLQNAMVNAASAIKQFFGGVGDEIAKVLDLKGGSDQLSASLGNAAMWFKTLTDEQKKSLVNWALYAAALGPAIKALSLVYSGGAATVSGLRAIQKALFVTDATTGKLTTTFKALSVSMKAAFVGPIIVGVLALAAAYVYLSDKIENANRIYNTLKEIEQQAGESASQERAKIGPLIAILGDENQKREDKAKALKELQSIAPGYFEGLNVEKINVDNLNESYKAYIDSILRAARAKRSEEKLAKLDEEKEQIQNKIIEQNKLIAKTEKEKFDAGIGGYAGLKGAQQDNRKTALANLKAEESAIEQLIKAVEGKIITNKTATKEEIAAQKAAEEAQKRAAKELARLQGLNESAADSAKKNAKEMSKAYSDVLEGIHAAEQGAKVFGNTFDEQADAIAGGIEKLIKAGFDTSGKEIQGLVKKADDLKRALGGVVPVQLDTESANADLKSFAQQAAQTAASLAEGLSAGFGAGNAGAQALVERAKDLQFEIGNIRPNMDATDAVATLDALRTKVAQFASDAQTQLGTLSLSVSTDNAKAAIAKLGDILPVLKVSATTEAARDKINALEQSLSTLKLNVDAGLSPDAVRAGIADIKALIADVSLDIPTGKALAGLKEVSGMLSGLVLNTNAGFSQIPKNVDAATKALLSGVSDVSAAIKSGIAGGFYKSDAAAQELAKRAETIQKEISSFSPNIDTAKAAAEIAGLKDRILALASDAKKQLSSVSVKIETDVSGAALETNLAGIIDRAQKIAQSLGEIPVNADVSQAGAAIQSLSDQAADLKKQMLSGFGATVSVEGQNALLGLLKQVDEIKRQSAAIKPGMDAAAANEALNTLRSNVEKLAADAKDKLGAFDLGLSTQRAKDAIIALQTVLPELSLRVSTDAAKDKVKQIEADVLALKLNIDAGMSPDAAKEGISAIKSALQGISLDVKTDAAKAAIALVNDALSSLNVEVDASAAQKTIGEVLAGAEALKTSLGNIPANVSADAAKGQIDAMAKMAETLAADLSKTVHLNLDPDAASAAINALRTQLQGFADALKDGVSDGFVTDINAATDLARKIEAVQGQISAIKPGMDASDMTAAIGKIRVDVLALADDAQAQLGSLKMEVSTTDAKAAVGQLQSILPKLALSVSTKKAKDEVKRIGETLNGLKANIDAGLNPDKVKAGIEQVKTLLSNISLEVQTESAKGDIEKIRALLSGVPMTINTEAASAALESIGEKAQTMAQWLDTPPVDIKTDAADFAIADLSNKAKDLQTLFSRGFSSSMKVDDANAALELLRSKVADFSEALKSGISQGFIQGDESAKLFEQRAESLRQAFASVPVDLSLEDATNALNRLSGEAVALSSDLTAALDSGFNGGQPAMDALIGKANELQGIVNASFDKVLEATKATGQLASIPSNVTPRPVTSQTAPLAVKIPEVVPETFEKATGQAYLLEQGIDGISTSMASFVMSMGGGVDAMLAVGDGMAAMAEASGGAFEGLAGSLAGVEGSYKSVGAAALAAAAKMVQAALAATLAKAIQQSVARSGHPLLGIALAGVAVAGVNALFSKVMQGFKKTPKFATGTKNAPGGLALVGEFGREMVNLPKGARVHPANQTRSMLRDMTDSGRFNTQVEGTFRIKGSDLVVVLEKSTKKTNRIRGN